jgi:GT2 family glycosyltransferase
MAAIGIVVVAFNSGAHIGACLDSLRDAGAEVLVVDNASRDTTRDEVLRRGVRLLANASNTGFAAAANLGFQTLETPFILLLNPDAKLVGGLEELRAACALPGAGLAGGKLVDEHGRPQTGFMVRRLPTAATLVMEALVLNRLLPMNPVNRRYRCLDLDCDIAQPVEQPAGAFLMVRREVWQALGGFDEGFSPVWFEDVDFCRRAIAHGYRPYYTPAAVAAHAGGHSIAGLALETRTEYWYRSLLRYAAKHFRPWAVRAVGAAVVIGSIPRVMGAVVRLRGTRPVAGYVRVMKLGARLACGSCTR